MFANRLMVVLDTVFAKGLYIKGDVWLDFKIVSDKWQDWVPDNSTGGELRTGLNLTVFGLMAVIVGSDEGEPLVESAKSSENDLKLEIVGLEATGFAITDLSAASLRSISFWANLFKVSWLD